MSGQGEPSGLSRANDRNLSEGSDGISSSRGSHQEIPAQATEPIRGPCLEEMIMQETSTIQKSLLQHPVPTAENLLKLERWYCLFRAIVIKCEEVHARKDDEAPLQEVAELYKSARYPNPAVDKKCRERRVLGAKEFDVRSRRQMLLFERAANAIREALQRGRDNDRDGFRRIITTKLGKWD